MSTRALIGVESNGKVKSVYNHFDGYPERPGVGYNLIKAFNSKDKALELVQYGIRSIDKDGYIDRFSEDESPQIVSEGEFLKSVETDIMIEYVYLFKNGKWFMVDGNNKGVQQLDKVVNKLESTGQEDTRSKEDEFTSALLSVATLIDSNEMLVNHPQVTSNNKDVATKIKTKVKYACDWLQKEGFKYYKVDSQNIPTQKGQNLIMLNKEGYFIKMLMDGFGDFYSIEMYVIGRHYRARVDDNLIIERKDVKRKPNNINNLVKYVYGITL